MAPSVTLPTDVLVSLAALQPLIRAEVRERVREREIPRIVRSAQVAVRVNGRLYRQGAQAVLEASGIDAEMINKRLGDVPGISDEECDPDGSQQCDDDECRVCYPPCSEAGSCCGWCSTCETHHDDPDGSRDGDHLYRYAGSEDTRRNAYYICTSCEHVCEEF